MSGEQYTCAEAGGVVIVYGGSAVAFAFLLVEIQSNMRLDDIMYVGYSSNRAVASVG